MTDTNGIMLVRDYLPLQQGLRPSRRIFTCHSVHSQRLSSTTTRIKTPAATTLSCRGLGVRDYLPLQQGLRQLDFPFIILIFLLGQRLSSTTTRIKTLLSYKGVTMLSNSQRLSSTTTRIKTIRDPHHFGLFVRSETIFHYNKD